MKILTIDVLKQALQAKMVDMALYQLQQSLILSRLFYWRQKSRILFPYLHMLEQQGSKEFSGENIWLKRLKIMVHFLIIPLALFIIWQAQPGSSLFSWHPSLMILGFGFFMLEAILVFSKSSSLIPSQPRATKVKYHWILQSLAILCSIGGFLAIVINKYMRDKSHFKSWHGLLGGLTMLFACIQATMGITLLYPNLPLVNKLTLAQRKKLHALCGAIIFILSCFVIVLSFYSNWFLRIVELYSWKWSLCVICPILLAATVNNQVAQAYVFKKP